MLVGFFRFFLIFGFAIISHAAMAYTINLTVMVPDGNNSYEPGIGVTIRQDDNLGNGVAADINGNATLNVPNASTQIRLSGTGLVTQTMSAANANNNIIKMQEDSALLNEVTVVAQNVNSANYGCDNEDNNRITAELALCSTHVYNIGHTSNQSGSERQLMRDVIALKTTVIAQQMNKQYEYMDGMMRRLKTQLEKAILTTKLQAAGAGTRH